MIHKKYKIMLPSEKISDDEIEHYKNFDALLRDSTVRKNKIRLIKTFIIIGALLLMTGGILFFFKGPGKGGYHAATGSFLRNAPDRNSEVSNEATAQIPVPSSNISGSIHQPEVRKASGNLIEKTKGRFSKTSHKPLLHQNEILFRDAEPAGGYNKLFAFFKTQLRYPEEAKIKGITGSVVLEFYIDELGKAKDIAVIESVNPILNEEAKRLVNTMPAWKPAVIDGKTASTRQVIPITFTLDKN